MARAFHPNTCRTSSTGFIAPTPRGLHHKVAAGGGWKYPKPLGKRMAGRLKFKVRPVPARRSPCVCRRREDSTLRFRHSELSALPRLTAIAPLEQRRSHQRGCDSHHHHYREQPGQDDALLQTDVDENEFHCAASIHEY